MSTDATSMSFFDDSTSNSMSSVPINATAIITAAAAVVSFGVFPSLSRPLSGNLSPAELNLDQLGLPDTSQIPYPGTLRVVSWWEACVKVAFYVVLVGVSLVGNTVVLTIVYRNKAMRNPTTYYLVNLAVCDVMVTLLCTWVHLVVDLSEGWVLGAFFCKFSSFVQVLSLVSSILTLTLIACDRFFGIVCAVRAHLAERGRSWPVFLGVVWVLSGLIAAPLLFYRTQLTRVWLDHVEVWCADVWPDDEDGYGGGGGTGSSPGGGCARQPPAADRVSYRTLYYTCVTLVLYFVPVVVMSLAYVVIVGKLWSHRRPGEGRDFDMSAQLELTVKKKVIKMLSLLLSVFVVCWLPSQVTILYAEYRTSKHLPLPSWYHGLQYFATFLAYTNSALNPVIYTCFNENFRKGFRECFRCRRRTSAVRRRRFDLKQQQQLQQQQHETNVDVINSSAFNTDLLTIANNDYNCRLVAVKSGFASIDGC